MASERHFRGLGHPQDAAETEFARRNRPFRIYFRSGKFQCFANIVARNQIIEAFVCPHILGLAPPDTKVLPVLLRIAG